MYCVYITEYFGDKMPRYYIGSTSVSKIENGYKGSVSSISYKSIWESEPNSLFETKIVKEFSDRKSALEYELVLQKEYDVVNNPEYINMSYAIPNGHFGRDVSGNKNPMFGRNRTGETHKGGENISSSLKKMYSSTPHGIAMKQASRDRMITNNPAKDRSIVENNKIKWKESGRNLGERNGMFGKESPSKGKKLYNDGNSTKAYIPGEQPEGWTLGRHFN